MSTAEAKEKLKGLFAMFEKYKDNKGIDKLVYQLYGITEEEKKIIWKSLK